MKNYNHFFLGIAVIACFVATAMADPITGRVVRVKDGDTLTVLDAAKRQHDVRLAGIDAPESGQDFGNRAKQALSDCAFGKTARIDGEKIDNYGRTVGKVIVDGVDCNLRQVELGLAWHYKQYEREQSPADRRAYDRAETQARLARTGLWSQPAPTPPWTWRHGDQVGTQKGDAALRESAGQCDCAAGLYCPGKRGGQYCLTSEGNKRYAKR